MAAVKTLSPSSEGCCLVQPSNPEAFETSSLTVISYEKENNDIKSAPEATEGEHTLQNAIKQARGRRRKRRNSGGEHLNHSGVNHNNQNGKRRRGNLPNKRQNFSGRIILPNKFLLGGNITDPLNLNSMLDENINRALNAVTPSSSPLPPRNSTIDIVQPSDVTDPLGLNSSGNDKPTVPPETGRHKNKRKRRHKRQAAKQEQQNSDVTSNSDDQKLVLPTDPGEEQISEVTKLSSETSNNGKEKKHKGHKNSPTKCGRLNVSASQVHIKDPIVSPVVPQDIRRHRSAFQMKPRRRRRIGCHSQGCGSQQPESSGSVSSEQFRAHSEKTDKSDYISPVRRRRTVSENLTSERFWDGTQDLDKQIPLDAQYSLKKLLPPSSVAIKVTKADNQGDDKTINKDPSVSSESFMNKEVKEDIKESPKSKTESPSSNEPHPSKKRKPSYRKSSHRGQNTEKRNVDKSMPQQSHFQYGNYSQYYGYRNPEKFKDVRMESLKKDWFRDKDVLDIGCNAGHLTLLIARDHEPRKIVGIDIDKGLIQTARKNIRHYASTSKSSTSTKFPSSMVISFGPLAVPPVETGKDETTAAFPNNVNFFQGNYVPQKDEFLRFQEPEYDVIMCMSVTKWIHLNWGDAGLIRMFKRVFKQLRAGGMFILEPQQWHSYKSKRRMTEKLNEVFKTITLFPESFPSFLIKEIGFERVEHLCMPKKNKSAGFQRPIQIYYKPE